MQSKDPKEDIVGLEIQLAECEKKLDSAFEANKNFATTRGIFRELKKIKERLEQLKQSLNSENHNN